MSKGGYEHASDAFIGAGISQGFSKGFSSERKAERAQARARAEESRQELDYLQRNEGQIADLRDQKLQLLQQEQDKQMRLNNKQLTFSAFERYDGTSDARHLNQMVTDLNKNGSQLFGDIAYIDKVQPTDEELVNNSQLGLTVEELLENPEVAQSFVKVTTKDGFQEIRSVDELKGATGYNDYATEKELSRQKNVATIRMLKAAGYPGNQLAAEAFRRARAEVGEHVDLKSPEMQEAFTKHYDELRKSGHANRDGGSGYDDRKLRTEAERMARIRTETQDGLYEGDTGYEEAFSRHYDQIIKDKRTTADRRNQDEYEAAIIATEEAGFNDIDWSKPQPSGVRRKFERHIRAIERFSGNELTGPQIAELANIKKLTSLAENASQVTDEQTGIIDSVLRTARSYINDNVEGTAATAAYNSFANLVRHALYGSTQTKNEDANFAKAFGNLKQQRGPVLVKLRTQLEEIRGMYDTLAQMKDPYVMEYRAGVDEAQLYNVIGELDRQIDQIDRMYRGIAFDPNEDGAGRRDAGTPSPDVLTPEAESSMDNIASGLLGG